MSATEMLASERLRGLLVFGSDLAIAAPDTNAVRASLKHLELLVVVDTIISETAELADVVLPVTVWAEEDGTTTNLEGRVLRRRRAVEPPLQVRTDLEVISDLAQRLGCTEGFRHPSTEALFDELRRASACGRADYAGISYKRLDSEPGLFWPCPTDEHPGTPRLFAERFAHPDGRARMIVVDYRSAAEEPDDEYPLYLTTGRHREHYNSGTQTRRLERLSRARPLPRLQLHPALAQRLGLVHGDSVRAETRRGSAVFEVDVDAGIREDTVFLPFHWGGRQAANQLTTSALDPVSRMPEFKVCAVRLSRTTASQR